MTKIHISHSKICKTRLICQTIVIKTTKCWCPNDINSPNDLNNLISLFLNTKLITFMHNYSYNFTIWFVCMRNTKNVNPQSLCHFDTKFFMFLGQIVQTLLVFNFILIIHWYLHLYNTNIINYQVLFEGPHKQHLHIWCLK